jgi:filamentous hemagglutinin family protein
VSSSQKKKMRIKIISALAIFFYLSWIPAVAVAGEPVIPGFYGKVSLPAPAPAALPVLNNIVTGAQIPVKVNSTLTIKQTAPKAILEWDSFDIGSQASVRFDQSGNISWAALNRILDQNPSQIFGSLTADGHVYLINQNGILFGQGSRVNVHSLIASSLDLSYDNFKNNILSFTGDDSRGAVANLGTVQTDYNGSVFLIGPEVSNTGTISAPYGEVGLIAGNTVSMTLGDDGFTSDTGWGSVITGENGVCTNAVGASILADSGKAGMYGRIVNQEGLVRSVTALKKGGTIELRASELVNTGPGSLTVCPVDSSGETADQSFAPQALVSLMGLDGGSVDQIRHQGVIAAPHGRVELNARERVLLDSGSSIDVSGVWSDKPADANLLTSQLNSVELRDDMGQKDSILKGETVGFDARTGTAIGDTSGTIKTTDVTAMDQSTAGGMIMITATEGDIISMPGSSLSFAGGGYNFGSGTFQTTKLLNGNKIYDIGSAPEWLTYDKVLDEQVWTYNRFGVTEKYQGLYYGGAYALKNYSSGYQQGCDAGSLSLIARGIALGGSLDGSVVVGPYQTLSAEDVNISGQTKTRGRQEPAAGSLTIGKAGGFSATNNDEAVSQDHLLSDVVIGSESRDISASDNFSETTYLPVETLNKAGLKEIRIFNNEVLSVEKGADLTLQAGGQFTGKARRIEVDGSITAPSGKVELTLEENKTYPDTPIDQKILISGSIDASGLKIDNSNAGTTGKTVSTKGRLSGGTVTLYDQTLEGQGVAIAAGGSVRVNGGYEIDEKGKVTGGDAGTLNIMGSSIALDGEIQGASLVGSKGGTIDLRAPNIVVSKSGDVQTDLVSEAGLSASEGVFVLNDHRLDETGFSQVILKTPFNITIEDGVVLRPSYAKLITPTAAGTASGTVADNNSTAAGGVSGALSEKGLFIADREVIGSSALTLNAGIVKDTASISEYPVLMKGGFDDYQGTNTESIKLPSNSSLEVGPKGTVSLNAPVVDIAGSISAPAGTIKATATSSQGLTIQEGARISAAGYNKPDTTSIAKGLPAGFTPVDGGTISLTAKSGDISIKKGAVIDVSGSPATTLTLRNSDGTLSYPENASSAGTLTLSYTGNLYASGDIIGRTYLPGLKGGTLSIEKTDIYNFLSVTAADIDRYQESGFDALTFKNPAGLSLEGGLDRSVGRSLTFDSPVIRATGDSDIHLNAPNIMLTSSYKPATGQVSGGQSTLELSGDWIDVEGVVQLDGFGTASLKAAHDIRLADKALTDVTGNNKEIIGKLTAPGNLTLAADRIYPATNSTFTIKAGGDLTTLPGSGTTTGEILSAGGSLTLDAKNITHKGAVYAPLGEITLHSTDRTALADGSILSTRGSDHIPYGTLGETAWGVIDKNDPTGQTFTEVSGAPAKSIEISSGSETIVKGDATIDASGGGSIFGYRFLPGIDGSSNPLVGKYILVPGLSLPGDTVTLSAGAGLASGTYTLVHVDSADDGKSAYAFLPGAKVLTDLGVDTGVGSRTLSAEGYPLVGGYPAVAGASEHSPLKHLYSVQTASALLKGFSVKEIVAGDAGSVSIDAPTAIVSAKVSALPLGSGYKSGSLTLSAIEANVVPSSAGAEEIGIGEVIPEDLKDKCTVSAEAVNNASVGEIRIGKLVDKDGNPLGDDKITKMVTLQKGAVLTAPSVSLNARDTITMESGSSIDAAGMGGSASLITQNGTISIADGAEVKAGSSITLDAQNLDNHGSFTLDHGSLNLRSTQVSISSGDSGSSSSGMKLTVGNNGTIQGFSGFDSLSLEGLQNLAFSGNVSLSSNKEIVLDAPLITHEHAAGDPESTVGISAQAVTVRNTSGRENTEAGRTDTAGLNITADRVTIGQGKVLADGFGNVNITSKNELTFTGQGSLKLDGGTGKSLNITAGQITAAPSRVNDATYQSDLGHYVPADFKLDAVDRTLTITNSNVTGLTSSNVGGKLEISAQSISDSGTINMPSGSIVLNATNGNIRLGSGSQILASGTDQTPAGTVTITAGNGDFSGDSGSKIDVSAGTQGDAGSISVSASGNATIDTELDGAAQGSGRGGTFSLEAGHVPDLGGLVASLNKGGMNEAVSIRTHNGDLELSGNDENLTAHTVQLTADTGSIDISGTIDASGSKGGYVDLNAGTGLTLSGTIDAHATGAGEKGGEVWLGSGYISNPQSDSEIPRLGFTGTVNVKGGDAGTDSYGNSLGAGQGGAVYFRAQRTGTGAGSDVAIDLTGTVTGASRIAAEAVKKYNYSTLGTTELSTIQTDTSNFMSTNNVQSMRTRLNVDNLYILPGIEVDSATDLTLSAPLDLTTWRFQGEPGMLTLRAAGNLNLSYDLTDHPTAIGSLAPDAKMDSWGLSLVAGADFSSADPMAVVHADPGSSTGNLNIGSHLVYTESGPLNFSAGNSVKATSRANPGYMVNSDSNMKYNIATFDGSIRGSAGNDINLTGGGIQSGTGDIDLTIGRDLVLGQDSVLTSAIRTTGFYLPGSKKYWNYSSGGDIHVDAGRDILGGINAEAWDSGYPESGTTAYRDHWAAAYETKSSLGAKPTLGIVTMGGGDISIRAGRDFTSQTGTFGQIDRSDLNLMAGRDINGRFLVTKGRCDITAMGNFGVDLSVAPLSNNEAIEAFDTKVQLWAAGDVVLGSVVNPSFARPMFPVDDDDIRITLGYTADSGVKITSLTGDVTLRGESEPYNDLLRYNASVKTATSDVLNTTILPASLEIKAGRDIHLEGVARDENRNPTGIQELMLYLTPSPTGKLSLNAGRDIVGSIGSDGIYKKNSGIWMSDCNSNISGHEVYGYAQNYTITTNNIASFSDLIHQNDIDRSSPATVSAGRDIQDLNLTVPKSVQVLAGNDVRDMTVRGQNLYADDISLIKAGHDIILSTREVNQETITGIEIGGPGTLIVQAGNNIDLGATYGIQSVANVNNFNLGDNGSDLIVASGVSRTLDPRDVTSLFDEIKNEGKEYSSLLSSDPKAAAEKVAYINDELIAPVLGNGEGTSGDILMTRSQIKTYGSSSDINILAAGKINVGRSDLSSDSSSGQQTGITTDAGGRINTVALGDVNVLESRMMTLYGGDIVVWSAYGDINAGRGSKTAINRGEPRKEAVTDPSTGKIIGYRYVEPPVAVGSGIRTLTYDPDGLGPRTAPPAGDAYIFAPSGYIDAGEAGIMAENLFLGAEEVRNTQNIQVSGISVGVPQAASATGSIAALSGTSNLSDSSSLSSQMAGISSSSAHTGKTSDDEYVPKWVKVMVIGFGDNDQQDQPQDQQDKDKDKKKQ